MRNGIVICKVTSSQHSSKLRIFLYHKIFSRTGKDLKAKIPLSFTTEGVLRKFSFEKKNTHTLKGAYRGTGLRVGL